MRKTFYALFLIAVLCFMMPCDFYAFANEQFNETNAFRIIRQTDDSGKIAISYIFPVNSKSLQNEKFNEDEIRTYRFYLSTYVNALAQQNRAKAIDGMSVSNCTYFTDVDGLGFSIVFDSVQVQKTFFGLEDDKQDEEKKSNTSSSGFFMKKVELKTTFPVSSTKSAGDLRMICNMAISSWCKDNSIDNDRKNKLIDNLNKSLFIYDFASINYNLKSDTMYDDENFHHNIFVKSISDIEQNNEIAFYMVSPNTPIWYLSALVLVVLGMLISYFVLRKKKEKK